MSNKYNPDATATLANGQTVPITKISLRLQPSIKDPNILRSMDGVVYERDKNGALRKMNNKPKKGNKK